MENKARIIPTEFRVLVLPKDVEEVTEGGIVLPPELTEKEELAQVEAELIDIGGNAFTDPRWLGRIPDIGDTVLINRYAGFLCTGHDGQEYRIINDKDVVAIKKF